MKTNQNQAPGIAYSQISSDQGNLLITDNVGWNLLSTLFKSISSKVVLQKNSVNNNEVSLDGAKIFNKDLSEKILTLDKTSQQVIYFKFGLLDGQRNTIEQISAKLGLSNEEVRSILTRIIFIFRQNSL